MPQTITDSGGEEIEVFTSEELKEQQEEAVEKYKEENPDKTEEMEALEKERDEAKSKEEELQKQLDGELDKDKNFANLRKQKEEAEEKAEGIEKTIDEKVATVKNEILEGNVKDFKKEQLDELAGDDKELREKIEFHYDRIKDTAVTKEEVSKKLRDSWTLATAGERQEVSGSAFSSGGATGGKPKAQSTFSSEEKDLAKKLAEAGGLKLEDKDFNK